MTETTKQTLGATTSTRDEDVDEEEVEVEEEEEDETTVYEPYEPSDWAIEYIDKMRDESRDELK